MKPSKLRHRITIEERTQTADNYGGFTESWATHATVWAEIQAANGSERFFAGKLAHNVTHKIIIRHLPTLTADMRLKFGSRIFKIVGLINHSERGRWHEITAEEGEGS